MWLLIQRYKACEGCMLAYCCVQLVPIVAIQPCVAQEGLIDHAARVLAAPFSTELSGLPNLGKDLGEPITV